MSPATQILVSDPDSRRRPKFFAGDQDFRRRPRFLPATKISVGDQDFRRRPRFLSATKIFAGDQDFRRRPKFSPATKIFVGDQDFRRRPRFSPETKVSFFFGGGWSSNIKRRQNFSCKIFRRTFFSSEYIWSVRTFCVRPSVRSKCIGSFSSYRLFFFFFPPDTWNQLQ